MARRQNLGASEDWFVDEDKTLSFEIYGSDDATITDVSGIAFEWILRKQGESDAIVLTKTTGASSITITGTFNADPAVNTQRVDVDIDYTDTQYFQPGIYSHLLRRTTIDSRTIASYGDATLKKA